MLGNVRLALSLDSFCHDFVVSHHLLSFLITFGLFFCKPDTGELVALKRLGPVFSKTQTTLSFYTPEVRRCTEEEGLLWKPGIHPANFFFFLF